MWVAVVLLVMVNGEVKSAAAMIDTKEECETVIAQAAYIASESQTVKAFGVACIESTNLTVKGPSKEPPPRSSGS